VADEAEEGALAALDGVPEALMSDLTPVERAACAVITGAGNPLALTGCPPDAPDAPLALMG
jgi:hypothetical protein